MKDIGYFGLNLFQEKDWLSVDVVGIVDEQDVAVENNYVAVLKTSNTRLNNSEDSFVWIQSKSVIYSPKDGYKQLIMDKNNVEISWWWKALWKFKCPLKTKKNSWF